MESTKKSKNYAFYYPNSFILIPTQRIRHTTVRTCCTRELAHHTSRVNNNFSSWTVLKRKSLIESSDMKHFNITEVGHLSQKSGIYAVVRNSSVILILLISFLFLMLYLLLIYRRGWRSARLKILLSSSRFLSNVLAVNVTEKQYRHS